MVEFSRSEASRSTINAFTARCNFEKNHDVLSTAGNVNLEFFINWLTNRDVCCQDYEQMKILAKVYADHIQNCILNFIEWSEDYDKLD